MTFARVKTTSEVKECFVRAKPRVAPSENKSNMQASIPRFKLFAATIGARLTSNILETLSLKNVKVYYWSDSSTVVAWIHREGYWSVFVENRVEGIKKLTDFEQWRHISGHLNPADLPPRSCTAKQLLFRKWWEKPVLLLQEPEEWSSQELLASE